MRKNRRKGGVQIKCGGGGSNFFKNSDKRGEGYIYLAPESMTRILGACAFIWGAPICAEKGYDILMSHLVDLTWERTEFIKKLLRNFRPNTG